MSYNLGTATGRIIIDGSGAQKGFAVASVAAEAFYGVVRGKMDSVKQLGTNLTAIGTTGTVGLGLAIRKAADFEAGLSAVKAVSGATTEEMELLRKKALQIGKDTSFSASEAVDAISELTKAGVSTTDVLSGAADATVALAAAGEIDLPRAAEIASSAINNFALSGKELPHVADLIAGAANASAIDVGDFGFSLSQAGAVANLVGLSFDDLAVAIAEMGQAGIKGSDAGTSIKTFLSNLIPTTEKQINLFEKLGLTTVKNGADFSKLASVGLKPASSSLKDVSNSLQKYVEKAGGAAVGTKANADAANQLGINMGIVGNSFFDAQGKMLPFKDIQGKLAEATKNLSKEQKLQALDTLFGSDAIRASAVFANQGAEGFDKMAGAIGKVKAADVAATRLDNLNGSIERLKGSFETMMIIIGDVFLPIVRKVVDAVNSLVSVFLELPEPVQKAIAIMIGLGSAFSLFTGILIKLAFFLVPMLARFLGFMALKQVFSIFTTGFQVFRSGAGAVTAVTAALGRGGVVISRFVSIGKTLYTVLASFPRILAVIRTAATLAFGPWGIALALVVGAVVLAYNKFKPFHDLVDSLGRIVKGALIDGLNALKAAFDQVVVGFRTGKTEAEGFFGFLQGIGMVASLVVNAVLDLGRAFMEHVVPALQKAGGELLGSLKSAWNDLSETFRTQVMPALRELGAAFQEMLPALQQLWTALLPVVKFFGILAAVVAGVVLVTLYALLKLFVTYLLPAIIFLVTKGLQLLINVLQFVVEAFIVAIGVAVRFGSAIVQAIMGAVQGVTQALTGLVNIVKGVFNIFAGLFTGDWKRMWEGAKQTVQGFKDVILGLLKGMTSAVLAIIKGFVAGIINFFKGLYNTLVGHSIVPDMVNAIIKWIAMLPGKAAAALGSLGSAVVGKVRAAMNSMKDSVRDGIASVVGYLRALPGKMRSALGNLGGILRSAGQQIINGLISGLRSKIGEIRSTLASVTNLIPDWKGPMDKDKKLLTKNGIAIMQSLLKAFEAQMPSIERFLSGLTKLIAATAVPPTNTIGTGVKDAISAGVGSKKKTSTAKQLADAAKKRAAAAKGKLSTQVQPKTVVNNYNYQVHNPVAEKTSLTITREATRRAAIGVAG